MSNFDVYEATVVQPDPDGETIELTEVRERLKDKAPGQVFIVLGDGQTMFHPYKPEEIFASGPAIVVVTGLYDRSGLRLNVLS